MANLALSSQTVSETQPGAVVPTNIAKSNVISVSGAKHIVMYIDGAAEYVSICHMETNR